MFSSILVGQTMPCVALSLICSFVKVQTATTQAAQADDAIISCWACARGEYDEIRKRSRLKKYGAITLYIQMGRKLSKNFEH